MFLLQFNFVLFSITLTSQNDLVLMYDWMALKTVSTDSATGYPKNPALNAGIPMEVRLYLSVNSRHLNMAFFSKCSSSRLPPLHFDSTAWISSLHGSSPGSAGSATPSGTVPLYLMYVLLSS